MLYTDVLIDKMINELITRHFGPNIES